MKIKSLLNALNNMVVKFLISAVILYLIFNKISGSQIFDSLYGANLNYILPGLLITSVMRIIPAFGTKALIMVQGLNIDTFRIIKINFITAFYGLFLPGFFSGGPVKLYKLTKFNNSPTKLVTCLIFERIIDTMVLIIIGLLFFLPHLFSDFKDINTVLFIMITSLILLALFFFIISNENSYKLFNRIITKLNIDFLSKKLFQFQIKVIDSIKQYKSISWSVLIYITGIALAKHLLGIISFYLFALSVNINIQVTDFAWIRSVLLLAISLPISLSGLGIREGVLIYLLSGFSIPPENTVAFSLILFLRLLFVGIIGGIFEFWNFYFSTDKI